MKYLLFSLAIVPLMLAALADSYAIDGADVRVSTECAEYGRSVVYVLTATDMQARTYLLWQDTTVLLVSHTGLVDVDGDRLIWLQHKLGDRATVSIGGGPCEEPVPRLSPLYRWWLPLVMR
jgi:hypothetical protein